MDTEFAALRHKEHLRRLQEQIEDMLVDKAVDYRRLIKELPDRDLLVYFPVFWPLLCHAVFFLIELLQF